MLGDLGAIFAHGANRPAEMEFPTMNVGMLLMDHTNDFLRNKNYHAFVSANLVLNCPGINRCYLWAKGYRIGLLYGSSISFALLPFASLRSQA